MTLQKYNNIDTEIKLLHAIFGEPRNDLTFYSEHYYKKYLKIGTSNYFFSGMILSDFLYAYKKVIQQRKTNDILNSTFTFSEKFLIDTLIDILVKICKKKGKDIKTSLQLLYIIIKDRGTIDFIVEQLDYLQKKNISVSDEAYATVKATHNFHLFLLKRFIQESNNYTF